jgi:replicative DNA helicase
MLKSCPLFSNGGNYSDHEIEWYRNQMTEIDQLFIAMSDKRKVHIADINMQIEKLRKDPTTEFNLAYVDSIK